MGGAQNFVGLLAGDRYGALASGTGTATADDINVLDYQKNGVTAFGAGSNLNLSNSTVTGVGPTGLIAQSGALYMNGATGTVHRTTRCRDTSTPGPTRRRARSCSTQVS